MMLLWNLAGAGAILAWNAVCGAAIFGLLKAIKLFRVDEADEIIGMDIIKHNEPAYPKPVYPKGENESQLCRGTTSYCSIADINIEEDHEPRSPITAALYRDEMINYWAKRGSVSHVPTNLSGTS